MNCLANYFRQKLSETQIYLDYDHRRALGMAFNNRIPMSIGTYINANVKLCSIDEVFKSGWQYTYVERFYSK